MKKITFIIFLITASFGFSQNVVENFDSAIPGSDLFGTNGVSVSQIADPTGSSKGDVLQLVSSAAGDPWQQAELVLQGDWMDLTTDKTAEIDVYSLTPFTLLAKVVSPVGAGPESATSDSHGGTGWETLNFNFSSPEDGTGVANDTYAKILLLPNWAGNGTGNNGTNNNWNDAIDATYYVDEIRSQTVTPPPTCSDGIQNQGETGVDCGGPCLACPVPPGSPPTTPPNRASGDVVSIYSNAYTNRDDDGDSPETFGSAVVTELDYSGNTINQVTTPVSGAGLQYKYFGTTPQYLDLSSMTTMHIDFYFEGSTTQAGTVFIVIAQASDGTNIQKNFDVTTTGLASNTWHEMDVNFTNFDGNAGYARNAIRQVIVQVAGGGGAAIGPFYFDNLYFHNGTVLSNDDFSKTSFSVFPNPTQDSWSIKTQNINISAITVYDVLGKNVMTLTPNRSEATIDASSLVKGMYFAKIETESGSSSIKLIKQ